MIAVAKRRKTKSRRERISFRLSASGRKKRTSATSSGPRLTGVLKVLAVVGILAVVGLLLHFAGNYVKSVSPVGTGPLELVDVPEWASEELRAKIRAAAGGETFRLDDGVAQLVAGNLASVAWLRDAKVQTTHNSVCASAVFRKPVALVKSGLQKFYVDEDLVVLDFVALPNLPIVSIKGLSASANVPPPGEVWHKDDLAAAVTILARLDRMDELVSPDRPLLYEIDSIDVSNFNGRENSRAAHIILYAKDGAEIIWGAQMGAWQRYLEATDEEKLAKLYGYYKECGTLLNGVKYINLREPQETIPQPVDKY